MAGQSGGEIFGREREGGHAHFKPRTGARVGSAQEHAFEEGRVEHRPHVRERRAGLVESLVVPLDVGDEGFGFAVNGREEIGLAVVGVAGSAAQALNLTGGVGFHGIEFELGNDLGREGGFFFSGEIEAGSLTAFFIGAEAALGVPVLEVGELGRAGGGFFESFVTGRAIERGGKFLSAGGIAGREFGGVGGVVSGGFLGEVSGQ